MEFFKGIDKVKYEGTKTNNLLAFAHYNPEEVILGKKMKDHLKFAMSYWHTLTGEGTDPYGNAILFMRLKYQNFILSIVPCLPKQNADMIKNICTPMLNN